MYKNVLFKKQLHTVLVFDESTDCTIIRIYDNIPAFSIMHFTTNE